jgi:geranylgeranyl diphosphate synthase type I
MAMIAGKTAAIVQFAAWSGAVLGGADAGVAARYGAFGQALGLGFQIQDDLLGIWGAPEVTGKAAADDIRRRKQSLPIVCLFESAMPDEREALHRIYAAPSIEPAEVELVARRWSATGSRRRFATWSGSATTTRSDCSRS